MSEMSFGAIAYYAYGARKGDAQLLWEKAAQEPWEAAARAVIMAAFTEELARELGCQASPQPVKLVQRDACVRVPEVCGERAPAKAGA